MIVSAASFVSLDSSILANLSRDYFSSDSTIRAKARRFVESLVFNGFVPFLCWHQFEELIKHENKEVAANRVAFLRSLPHVAWVPTRSGESLGGIVDVLVAECSAILDKPQSSVAEVRDAARERLIAFGTGAEAVKPYEDIWPELRPYLRISEARAREIVAISRVNVVDISNERLGTFLNGSLRAPHEAAALLLQFQRRMTDEIRLRGDKRITNPGEVAEGFYSEVAAEGEALLGSASKNPADILEACGLTVHELSPDARMCEILALAEFRSKLKVAHRSFTVSWEKFRDVKSPEQVPSWTVESSMASFGQQRVEHKGSELNDRHLACLSPYCHVTYVDRQAMEDIRRARSRSPNLRAIMNVVEKVTPYERIQARIEKGDF